MVYLNGKQYLQVTTLTMTPQLRTLLTIIRDRETKRNDFIFYADRINRLLVEEGLNFLPTREKVVTTRTGETYAGSEFLGKICAVPVMRSGLSMETSLREVAKRIRIGHVLIQRDEETAKPIFFKAWLPDDIRERYVFMLDPMLATGGSAIETIRVLTERGVQEQKIMFINLISAPEGIEQVLAVYPQIRIITAEIDRELNQKAYILPGLGDYGDIYFGTTE
jgi:uracil phosphoribosyltransferase